MKTFTLNANITFKADDLDAAFELLSQHFDSLRTLEWESPLEFTGNLSVQKVETVDGVGPEFAAEVERFFFDLSAKQEALGDPFADVLRDNAWDLYETDQK